MMLFIVLMLLLCCVLLVLLSLPCSDSLTLSCSLCVVRLRLLCVRCDQLHPHPQLLRFIEIVKFFFVHDNLITKGKMSKLDCQNIKQTICSLSVWSWNFGRFFIGVIYFAGCISFYKSHLNPHGERAAAPIYTKRTIVSNCYCYLTSTYYCSFIYYFSWPYLLSAYCAGCCILSTNHSCFFK